IGFGLLNLLVDALHAEARFFERALALAIVVLDDEILLFGQRPHHRQIGDLHRSEQVGRGQSQGARGLELAARIGADDHVALLYLGGGNCFLAIGKRPVVAVAGPTGATENRQAEHTKDYFLHRKFTIPFSESKVSFWPSWRLRSGSPGSRDRL